MLIGSLVAAVNLALAQTWMPTSASIGAWGLVASSADGSKLVVASPEAGPVCTSTNSGNTWVSNNVPYQDWQSVAASADGSEFLAANVDNNLLYISTNSGITWTSNNVPGLSRAQGMACSADGTKLAVVGGGVVCISTNSGADWTSNSLPSSDSVAFSADGTKIIVAGGSICISTNCGLTWTNISEPTLLGVSVACSADGSKLLVANANLAPGYISTNFGATWTSNSVLGNCSAVASSANASTILAVNLDLGMVYTSTDFGTTWTTNNLPLEGWWGVASSADGNKLVAVAGVPSAAYGQYGPGPIYTSYTPPSPQLNLAPANGNLALSWLVPSTNLVLQQNLDLSTTNWVTLTNTPTLDVSNLQNQAVLTPATGHAFYRLATP